LGTAADWLAACYCLWSAVVVEDEGSEGDAAVSLLFLSLSAAAEAAFESLERL
jgi:hypothetical protein